MRYDFIIVDVFTDQRFGGNQLAVLPDARGLGDEQMLAITREFNFSESTFVFPAASADNTREVRIFTPGGEVPFAGHPNVGTAFVLAATGRVPCEEGRTRFKFEEKAGLVPVEVETVDGKVVQCELTAPEPLNLAERVPAADLAHALHLSANDIVTARHEPVNASVGLPFVLAELASCDALSRAQADAGRLRDLFAANEMDTSHAAVHLYTHDCDSQAWDIQTRMFALGMGIIEDAATGSANCALAACLATLDDRLDHEYRYAIAQGVEMGRPSRLEARVEKRGGELTAVRIGGASVLVAEGQIEV